ncbi:hypothetical protein Ancab_026800 [Ancistrocladus abbreviatus]
MATQSLPLVLVALLVLLYPLAKGDADLIENTCKTTKYHDLCVSSLKSDPSSAQADTKGLAVIMINVGIANASDTYSYLSSQLLSKSSRGGGDKTMKMVLKLCADKYSYANESLGSSIRDLSSDDYDYASVQVTAAADYPNACHNAFRRYPGLAYPAELGRRESGLKHICDVVLGILDLLPIDRNK